MPSAYKRPNAGTETRRVWDIADQLTQESGEPAKRADVIERFSAEGGNANTASTQYHHWRKSMEANDNRPGKIGNMFDDGTIYFSVELKDAGRIVLPAEVRVALGVKDGGNLQGFVRDGEVHMLTVETAIRHAQERFAKVSPANVSLVDEFIADRREEARRESKS